MLLQIDEFWSYYGSKKKKCWIIYAYAPQTDGILACVVGKGDKKTVRKLMELLKNLTIDTLYTDSWESFIAELYSIKNELRKQHQTKFITVWNFRCPERGRSGYDAVKLAQRVSPFTVG